MKTNRKLRMGLIGGGIGSFIGKVHHIAAVLDNTIELVCGAFSSDPQKSVESGVKMYNLPEERSYRDYKEMILKEKELAEEKRMDFVAIVTPNHMHFKPAMMALENGFHVICDKPMTFNLDEAFKLKQKVDSVDLQFALTHTYTGYPMVKEAREIIKRGDLGNITKIIVEYTQGWLAESVEKTGNVQAAWRTDPNRAGITTTIGDIGTHAANMLEYMTGLEITHLCSDASAIGEGRVLDTDGSMLLKLNNGGKGVLTASQVCSGEENNLRIFVYGEKGGLEWHQMEPNTLILKWLNKPMEVLRTGVGSLSMAMSAHMRVPAGHPEGYIEAFANIYRNFAYALQDQIAGKNPDPLYDYPTVDDGVRGMKFIEAAVKSGKSDEKWISL